MFFRGIDPHTGQAIRVPMDADLQEDQDTMQKNSHKANLEDYPI